MLKNITNSVYSIQQLENDTLLIKTNAYLGQIQFTVKYNPSIGYYNFRLLENPENPLYASDQNIEDYFSRLENRDQHNLQDVDGIAGATITSQAIKKPLARITHSPFIKLKETVLYIMLWGLVILFSLLKKKIPLLILSGLWFLMIAILYNSLISIYSIFSLGSICQLLPLLAIISVLCYKNLYCSNICAFGFIQRITNRVRLTKKYRLPYIIRVGKYVLLVIALLSFLIGNRLYLEAYAFLFSWKTNWYLYFFPAAMLVISLFIPRFWCRGFCPVGAFLNIAQSIRRWILKQKTPLLKIPISSQKRAVWLCFLTFGLILLSNIFLYVF